MNNREKHLRKLPNWARTGVEGEIEKIANNNYITKNNSTKEIKIKS